jgi:type IV pilus assembly protein PilQ
MKDTIKRLLTLFIISTLTVSQLSCSSFGDGEDKDKSEISDAADQTQAVADSNELDSEMSADEGAPAEESAPVDEVAEEAPAEPAEEVPPPEIADDVAPPATPETPAYEDELSAVDANVRVTGLDYKANENGGTIVIQTSGPAKFKTEENNANNQYIVELENAELPSQFQRPYNTKEFSGVVGMINAYQRRDSNKVRIVIQLKKSTPVSVVQEGNSLVVVPGAAVASSPVSEISAPTPEKSSGSEVSPEASSGETVEKPTALNSKTLDEFLMGDTKFYGKKISIEVIDGEIRDVISFISEESGVNLVLSDEIKGKISVKLRQIPWDQALVVLMQTKQLGYIRQGSILRISTLASIRAETDSAKQLIDAQKQLEPLKVKVFPISYAKAKDLEPQAMGFLSTRGSAKADDRTNNLVVRDIAENVTKIEKLLSRLDTQTPQVYIEGKIVESKTSSARDIGISWADNSTGAANLDLATGVFTGSGALSLTAKLALLESDDKVKILSSPRIVTLDNQQANIEQSTQFPTYIVSVDAVTKAKTTTVEYKTVKLSLNVTPQITADGGVILKTEILREYAGAVDQRSPETGARSLNSRSAKSTILVENGNTAVLGGIYSTDNTEGNAGIPLLRKIPFIGWLFGVDKMTYDKNELLIFLTPRVINKDKAFTNAVSEGSETDSL